MFFSQIADTLPRWKFDACVKRYSGNKRIKTLSCRDQFLALMFGQLTNLNSLRSIILCLNAHPNSLYHLGFRTKQFTLSTLSRANQFRNWRIWQDFTNHLVEKARTLYIDDNDFSVDLKNTVYALDSTVIDLCLANFKWAYFELQKSAIKIHTQLDLKGNIPSFFLTTKAKMHDINFLDHIEFKKDAIYIMDRGYLHFKRLYIIHQHHAFFVVRSKQSLSFRRIYSRPVNKTSGLRCDQTTSQDPSLLGLLIQRSQDSSLRRHLNLFACCYRKKGIKSQAKSLRNITNPTGRSIRKNSSTKPNFHVQNTLPRKQLANVS